MSEPTESHEPLEEEDPNEVELAWAAEIESRIADVREGRVKGIPAAEVHAAAAKILASLR